MTTATAIKTQVFMFRYERVNSTRKFTIVAERVSLLKKTYKRDAPFRAVFKVKTLAVLFPPYPCEMRTNTAKFKCPAILAVACFYENGATHSHARSIASAWLEKYLTYLRRFARIPRLTVSVPDYGSGGEL